MKDVTTPTQDVELIVQDASNTNKSVAIIDVDKQKELAYQFNIQSIPTLIFVPMEGMPMLQLGALEKEDFVSIIDEVLLKKE